MIPKKHHYLVFLVIVAMVGALGTAFAWHQGQLWHKQSVMNGLLYRVKEYHDQFGRAPRHASDLESIPGDYGATRHILQEYEISMSTKAEQDGTSVTLSSGKFGKVSSVTIRVPKD